MLIEGVKLYGFRGVGGAKILMRSVFFFESRA